MTAEAATAGCKHPVMVFPVHPNPPTRKRAVHIHRSVWGPPKRPLSSQDVQDIPQTEPMQSIAAENRPKSISAEPPLQRNPNQGPSILSRNSGTPPAEAVSAGELTTLSYQSKTGALGRSRIASARKHCSDASAAYEKTLTG